jgi:Flp pilus assembly protein TadB
MMGSGSFPEPNDEALDFLSAGKKIDAIRAYRAQTGCGLAEARQALEHYHRGGLSSSSARTRRRSSSVNNSYTNRSFDRSPDQPFGRSANTVVVGIAALLFVVLTAIILVMHVSYWTIPAAAVGALVIAAVLPISANRR